MTAADLPDGAAVSAGRGHRGMANNRVRDRTCAALGRAARRAVAVIAGLLFMAGMRRSEVSALHWADVADAADGDWILVTVRRSKTNQEGETTDVRFVKGGVARAIRTGAARRLCASRGRTGASPTALPARPPSGRAWLGSP